MEPIFSSNQLFENVNDKKLKTPIKAGNLKNHLDFWTMLTSDVNILEIVQGYKIEFSTMPYQHNPRITPVPKNSLKLNLIQEEIDSLLQKQAIIQVQETPQEFISTIFLVPKKSGGMRPIINLKPLNNYVETIHFKMETLQTALNLLQKGDYLVSVDLKDAYFSIPIYHQQRKYLRFLWKNQRYEFQCLPFGLKSAPRIFTKCTKPVMSALRSRGHRGIIYIDDSLWMAKTAQAVKETGSTVVNIFQQAGFQINEKKSSLQPTQLITFLGYVIDTVQMTVSLPREKVQQILKEIQNLLLQIQPKIRSVAHVIGLLVSAFPAVYQGPLHYRYLERDKTKALLQVQSYQGKMTISSESIMELKWWIQNLETHNGKPVQFQDPTIVITTDASKKGWGGEMNQHRVSGRWSSEETQFHINFLELKAVQFLLMTLANQVYGQNIQIQVDNKTAVAYLNHMGGTHSTSMNTLAKEIWEWAIVRKIHLTAVHIPGVENTNADFLSQHFMDQMEWQLNQQITCKIFQQLFQPEVDLFASRLNFQIPRYVSWQPDPMAWRTDAFSIPWKNLKAFAFPPFNLISAVLQKVLRDDPLLILITPLWKTQPWYPQVLHLSCENPILLPIVNNLLTLPYNLEQKHPMEKTLKLVAWTVCGNASLQEAFQRKQRKYLARHGEPKLINNINLHGDSGWAGVAAGVWIHFNHL